MIDQILNFTTLNPGCGIVLHMSQGFDWRKSELGSEEFDEIIKDFPNVFINTESVRTGAYDIIQAHISNYKYVRSIVDFEFYCMCASNELFIKPGLYEHIKEYDCGVDYNDVKKQIVVRRYQSKSRFECPRYACRNFGEG